jgi:TetR/AcrR family transcriptional regulator, copper-responsive repressor
MIVMKNTEIASRPRGRPRAFDQQAALEAAMRLFWTHGYEATSMSDLSQVMGINPPSLYAAFGDKKNLFKLAVEAYQHGPGRFTAQALALEGSHRAAIERMLLEAAANFTDPTMPRGCMVVLSANNCSAASEDVRQSLICLRTESAAAICKRISRAAQESEFPKHLDPIVFGNLITSVFQGMSIRALDGATREELEAVVHQVMTLWPAPAN